MSPVVVLVPNLLKEMYLVGTQKERGGDAVNGSVPPALNF